MFVSEVVLLNLAMKKLAWIGIVLVGVVALGWLYVRPKWVDKAEQEAATRRNLLFSQGNVPLLPGPFIENGDPRDLHFDKIDLGIGEIISTSENGDVLYRWFGNQPLKVTGKDADGFDRTYLKLAKPVFRLRRRDGTIRDFEYPEVEEDIQLTRSGALIQIDRQPPFKIRKNGVLVYSAPSHPSKDDQTLSSLSSPHITDDLISSGFGKSYAILPGKFGFSFKLIDNAEFAYNCQSSSLLGSVYQVGSTAEVFLFKNSNKKKIELPSRDFGILGSTTAIYFNFSMGKSIPPQKYDGTTLRPVAHPKDAVDFNVLSANSKNDLLATVEKLQPSLIKEGVSFPYQYDYLYISRNKTYLLSDICESVGLGGSNQPLGRYSNTLFEDGSFAIESKADDFQHVFILRRES